MRRSERRGEKRRVGRVTRGEEIRGVKTIRDTGRIDETRGDNWRG